MEEGIDLLQLTKKLWKRKWVFISITMMSSLIAVILCFFIIQPVYEANVNIIIGKETASNSIEARYTNSDAELYLQLIKTYEEIAKSRQVMSRMEEKYKNDGFEPIKAIKVASKPDTQILTITVRHPSIDKVAVYANTFAEQFITVASEVFPAGQLKVLDKAEQPDSPSSPNRILIIAIAFLFGFILSVMVIMLLDYFNQTIESEQDVEYYLNLPVLCTLPKGKYI